MKCATILAGLMLLALPAAAQTTGPSLYALNAARSKFDFSIGHFMVSATEGKLTSFDGKLTFASDAPERGTVTIHVAPGSIDPGIAARDEHLRTADFFDVVRFPLASFQSSGLTRAGKEGALTGMLTLHGVTRPVRLDVTLQTPDLNADRLDFAARGKLKRSDFGMTSYMGMVGDEVTLTIAAGFDRQR